MTQNGMSKCKSNKYPNISYFPMLMKLQKINITEKV